MAPCCSSFSLDEVRKFPQGEMDRILTTLLFPSLSVQLILHQIASMQWHQWHITPLYQRDTLQLLHMIPNSYAHTLHKLIHLKAFVVGPMALYQEVDQQHC